MCLARSTWPAASSTCGPAVIEDRGVLRLDRTKSEAGVRVVGIPTVIVPERSAHMSRWAEPGLDGRVCVGPKGATPRRKTFNGAWKSAVRRAAAMGTPMPEGLHFHALRHTANGFAAAGGERSRADDPHGALDDAGGADLSARPAGARVGDRRRHLGPSREGAERDERVSRIRSVGHALGTTAGLLLLRVECHSPGRAV